MLLQEEVDRLYRECQKFAADSIVKTVAETIEVLGMKSAAGSDGVG